MGADYGKYCTCLNKESQTQEASLSRRVLLLLIVCIKEYYPINEDNPTATKNIYNIINHNQMLNSNIKIQKSTAHFRSSMSSESTDRIDHSTILIQKIDYRNGDHYIGKVLHNKREGKGKLTFNKGGYYEGDFHGNVYDGYGTLCTETSVYYGNFVQGEKSGNGKLENKIEGTEYIGHWKHNLKNGFGKETYPDGSFYEGNYENGMKKGKGVLSLANGSKYAGEFVNDNIEGQGTFIWNDKKQYIGGWKGNNLSGFGILKQKNDQHIGYFDNDRKTGLGLNYFYKSNSFLIGNWIDDSVTGLALFVNPNQDVQFWQMEDNKLIHYYKSNEEIEKRIDSNEYKVLKDFFSYLQTTNCLAELNINTSFSL